MIPWICADCHTRWWDAFAFETHHCELIICDCGHTPDDHAANYHQGCLVNRCDCTFDRGSVYDQLEAK